jgi:hypothetical protein
MATENVIRHELTSEVPNRVIIPPHAGDGIEVAQSTVAKYMVKHSRRPGQNWTTFLRNQAAGIVATGKTPTSSA